MASIDERIAPSDLLAVAAGAAVFLVVVPLLAAGGTYLYLNGSPPLFRAQANLQDNVSVLASDQTAPWSLVGTGDEATITVDAPTASAAASSLQAALSRLQLDAPQDYVSRSAAIDR